MSKVIKAHEWRGAEPYQLSVYPAEKLQEEIQAELEARRLEEEKAALLAREKAAQEAISQEGMAHEDMAQEVTVQEAVAREEVVQEVVAQGTEKEGRAALQETLAGETAGQPPLGTKSPSDAVLPQDAPSEPSPIPAGELSPALSSATSSVSAASSVSAGQPLPQIEKLLESAAEKARTLEAEAQKAAESLKADAQRVLRQAEEMRKEAEAQLAGARQEAARLVEEGRRQAADLVEKAQKEAEQILEEARERGYQDGLAQGREAGHREGYEAGIEETSGLAAQARTVLETALAEREQLVKGASQDILKLVVKIAEKIIRGQLRLDHAIIQRTIEDAVKLVNDKTRVVIRVNPSELELARSGEVKFRKFLEGSTQLEIVGDETIEPGGCMIETNSGSVDARIATQLEETAHLLEGLVHGG